MSEAFEQQRICLNELKETFGLKVAEWHCNDLGFHKWLLACGGISDFRRQISCGSHARFVYDQASKIFKGSEAFLSLPLWNEIAPQRLRNTFNYREIPQHPTLVTEHVAKCYIPTFPS